MAEEKKEPFFTEDHFKETIYFLIVLILVGYLLNRLVAASVAADLSPYENLWSAFVAWLRSIWSVLKIAAAALIGLSLWWSAYSRMRLHNIEKEEEKIYGTDKPATLLEELSAGQEPLANEKWATVLGHLRSGNSADWRLAIIEADIMLDELLRVQGYHGDSVGDKLKGVEPGDMKTLEAAWEAHKVRNRIAHAGSDFELNEREAKRVVALFESVFKEYKII